jgi:DDE family transposase
MTGDEAREVFEAMLPQEEIERLCKEFGVVQRQRKRNLGMCVRAMVISAGTPGGAYQAEVLRSYLECEVPQVARSAFYRWFDEPLARFMAALADRALAYARAQEVDLSGPLCGVKDWYSVDSSTTVAVRDALREEFSGTGDSAAIKVHIVLSVGCGAPGQHHSSPAREHDSRHLTVDESWRGDGLLADLAYASLVRLRACDVHGVRFVIRLKENWKPQVDYGARGDVHVGRGTHALPLRLVGVQTPTGDGFFLTNLPPRIGPRQVADLYRVRWEAELSIRLDKSVNRLDALDTEQPFSLKTLLPASTIAALLAHTHTV